LDTIKQKLDTSLEVSEWRHRATLGRDHYVRVVEEGALFPFGHRAALLTITERRFTPHGAFLIQQVFVIVREPVRAMFSKKLVVRILRFEDVILSFLGGSVNTLESDSHDVRDLCGRRSGHPC